MLSQLRVTTLIWHGRCMKCGIWNQVKIWSSHLLDNFSNCLMNLKNSGDSTGFEPMTSAMPVQWSNQLSYEVTQLRAGQFVGVMFSREENVVWKKWDNCLNCPASARIISSLDFKYRTSYSIPFRWVTWIVQVHETIDLFRLYILFSQYRSCANSQEVRFFLWFIKKSACRHIHSCMRSF